MRVCACGYSFIAESHALVHAKLVLLVDDNKPQVIKSNPFLKQGVRANYQRRLTALHYRERIPPGRFPLAAAQPRWLNAQVGEPTAKISIVLLCEQFGWRHDDGLHVTGYRFQARDCGNNGLA